MEKYNKYYIIKYLYNKFLIINTKGINTMIINTKTKKLKKFNILIFG